MYEKLLRANKRELKARLEGLLRDGPKFNRIGVCNQVFYTASLSASTVFVEAAKAVLYKDWPEHSGDDVYPVEGREAYLGGRDTLWQGEGLRKRQSLIRHMLMKLEAL